MDIAKMAERDLIGSILITPKRMVDVAEVVSVEDFSCINAQKAYVTALSLWKDKQQIDITGIATKDPSLVQYLTGAVSDASGLSLKHQAKRVALAAKERRIKKDINALLQTADPVDSKLDSLLRIYQREMFIDRKNPQIAEVLRRFDQHVGENKKRGSLGKPTGFQFLEEKYIQYVPGHIWLMGAFTSVGKTAMMIQKISNIIAMDDEPAVIVVSTEMTEEQVTARILGNFTGIYSQRILSGNLYHGEDEVVEEYKKLLKEKNIKIYDDVYDLADIETVLRKANLQGGVDIAFIDYVQNCTVKAATSEYQAGSMIAKGLQKLAKDVRATLICLSQVSNDVGRGNTEQLEYKGAGEWAAVADVGIFLHRHKTDKHRMKYSIKKNRHGPLHEHLFEYKANWSRLEPILEI